MNQYPANVSEYAEERKKLFCWFVKWLNKDENVEPINFDLPELSIILQTLGFKLQKFEKFNEFHHSEDGISVELKCKQSGMRSVLTKTNPTCKCPPEADVDRSQFWTITGCVPSSQENINRSSSSLLPTISRLQSKTIEALLNGALFVINSAVTDQNQRDALPNVNVSESSPFQRSFSLDTFHTPVFSQKGFKRQHSWKVDPHTSPPTQTSSPVPSLCTSLSEVSLNSGQEKDLLHNLKLIQKLAADSFAIASRNKNATFTKVEYKRVSDIKPEEPPAVNDTNHPPTPAIKTGTPRRMLRPKKFIHPVDTKNTLPSQAGVLNKKTSLSSRRTSTAKTKTRENPERAGVSKSPNLKPAGDGKPATRSRIANYVKLTPKLVYKVGKATEDGGNSPNPRFKNIVKSKSDIATYKPKS